MPTSPGQKLRDPFEKGPHASVGFNSRRLRSQPTTNSSCIVSCSSQYCFSLVAVHVSSCSSKVYTPTEGVIPRYYSYVSLHKMCKVHPVLRPHVEQQHSKRRSRLSRGCTLRANRYSRMLSTQDNYEGPEKR